MRRAPRRTMAIAVAAILVGACGHASSSQVTLGMSDNGRTVAIAAGDKLDVELDAIGPFYFGSPIVSTTAVRFVAESDHFANPPDPGGSKTQRYSFEAAASGRADITIPRQGLEAQAPAFGITVQVY